MSEPKATHEHVAGGLEASLEFLKRTRGELRILRKARVWRDGWCVSEVNG